VIDEDSRNDCNGKKDEVDEEFYCHILFNEQGKREEDVPESAEGDKEEALVEQKHVVIDDATVVSEGKP
jgi:hypothetical protein